MKSSAKKVELAPYDDLFSTEESRQDAKLEKIQEIPLSELHPFKGPDSRPQVRKPANQGWYPKGDSTKADALK